MRSSWLHDDDYLYAYDGVFYVCHEKMTKSEPFWAELCRRKTRRRKITYEKCTLPTIHQGPAGWTSAWIYCEWVVFIQYKDGWFWLFTNFSEIKSPRRSRGLFISLKFVKSQNHPSLYSKMQDYYRFGNSWLSSSALGFYFAADFLLLCGLFTA